MPITMSEVTAIVVCLILIIIFINMNRLKNHEACQSDEKLEMSKQDALYIIQHHMQEYVELYVKGNLNRTEMLQAITTEIQRCYGHSFGVDDSEWDYTLHIDPAKTFLQKKPLKEGGSTSLSELPHMSRAR